MKHDGQQEQQPHAAQPAVAAVSGGGGAQLSSRGLMPAVALPPLAVQRIEALVAACRSSAAASASTAAVSLAVASALSSLPFAGLLQDQADSVQQTLAVCCAFGVADCQPTGLSSNSRKQLHTLLPPARAIQPLQGESRQRLQRDLLDTLLPLMLAGVRYPRALLAPLSALLVGLGPSERAVEEAAQPFIARLSSSTAGSDVVGMAEVSVVEVALEWAPLAACLARHTAVVIASFGRLLLSVAAQWQERETGQQLPLSQADEGGGSAVDSAADPSDCVGESSVILFLRVFVQFVVRCKAQVYQWTSDDINRPQLASLLLSLTAIMQSTAIGRDPVTQAALLAVLLIQNPSADVADRLSVYQCLFFNPPPVDFFQSSASSPSITSSRPTLSPLSASLRHPVWSAFVALYSSLALSPHWFATCSPTGRLAMYRAILTQSPHSLLLQNAAAVEEAAAASPASSSSPCSGPLSPSLLLSLFPLVVIDCRSSSPQLRYYALHCLEVWCSTLELVLQSSADSLGSPPVSSSGLVNALPNCLSCLLDVLSVNWEHPYRVIIGVAKQLFSHFVRLSALVARPGQPDFMSFARPLLSACMSHHDRGAYQQLNVLAPHVGGLALLRECPTFIPHGLTAASYQPIWGVVGGMLQRLLALARQELTDTHDADSNSDGDGAAALPSSARASKRSKMKVKERQRVEAVLLTAQSADGASAEWRRLWLAPVASALLSDDEQTRQAVCTSLVAALLKLDNLSLAPLLSTVQAVQDHDTTSDAASADGLSFRHLRALLCVLTTARRIGLISSHQLHDCLRADERVIGRLPVTGFVLLACLVHADAGLRLECAELVCSNLYMAEMPSVSELQLLTQALPHLVQIEEPAVTTTTAQ